MSEKELTTYFEIEDCKLNGFVVKEVQGYNWREDLGDESVLVYIPNDGYMLTLGENCFKTELEAYQYCYKKAVKITTDWMINELKYKLKELELLNK